MEAAANSSNKSQDTSSSSAKSLQTFALNLESNTKIVALYTEKECERILTSIASAYQAINSNVGILNHQQQQKELSLIPIQ